MAFENKFGQFLTSIAEGPDLPTNTTSAGIVTIRQAERNKLRRIGLDALKEDLMELYSGDAEILETKDGIAFAVEVNNDQLTFTWELKSTIKSTDYDPFIEAGNWDEARAAKAEKARMKEKEREDRAKAITERRKAKLDEMAAKANGAKSKDDEVNE